MGSAVLQSIHLGADKNKDVISSSFLFAHYLQYLLVTLLMN